MARALSVAILRDALAALGLLRMRPKEVGKLWK
jgi:hypothetical protein